MFMIPNYASFYSEELSAPPPTPKLEEHPCWLSATAYPIYLQLPSILEAVLPSTEVDTIWGFWHTLTFNHTCPYPAHAPLLYIILCYGPHAP
jgi:hypothetical protein